MNYLFFDIECANCYDGKGKIYSFGYLICDQEFNMITPSSDILVNPDCKFDPYVKKHILAYPLKKIKESPKFDEVYNQIKWLMGKKDTICLGYGIENDTHFLADDCKRYGLKKIKAKIYDVQKLIVLALDRPARKLGIEYGELVGEEEKGAHQSDVDAYRTMLLAKEIYKKFGKPIHEYFEEKKATEQ